MSLPLSDESVSMLASYQRGLRSNSDLAAWLTQMEYDNSVSFDEKDELARLNLILTEALEGLRPGDQILQEVSALLACALDAPKIVTMRTSSATTWQIVPTTDAGSPVQLVDISRETVAS
jgi:hypothetical protein